MLRIFAAMALAALCPQPAAAQDDRPPLRIEVNRGVVKPMPVAIPTFVAEGTGTGDAATEITEVIRANLANSGLFRDIPPTAHLGRIEAFDDPIRFADWAAVNAQALVAGAVAGTADGRVAVKVRLWDVLGQRLVGDGQQIVGDARAARRIAHKVSDIIYSRLTGEDGYFDSRIAFVSETGPKNARRKQVAIMDQDGANLRYLTQDTDIVLSPRWSPNRRDILYTSFETGTPQVFVINSESLQRRRIGGLSAASFAPRFSPDGSRVVYSQSDGANTDIFELTLASGERRRLTRSSAIDTAPSFSPDGTEIVFESDRGGTQQLYVMPAAGGEARRISFGDGRYGTPVWSPRGDQIAFTKMIGGRFHIGVMRTDGSRERLLTTSFLDEAPAWSPNGRVIVFFRETPGASGAPSLYSVDITGRNLRKLPTPAFASDPDWSSVF